ncbi:MAG: DegV family protein [Clostridia bacterium]|nr:DegV family protein [Clostridia bacterium]
MSNYVIFTDSGCDIKPAMLSEWGVQCRALTFRFNDSDKEYSNEDMAVSEFYQKMRDGGVAKTAAINIDSFSEAFEALLAEGKDVLYLGFSSGLSTTYNSARVAAEELREKYPERKIITVDTLCASAGEGLIVRLVVDKKNEGATIEEAAKFAEDIKLKIAHWFTVDDLVYLKRGGRVSPTVAFVGNTLGIKPIMHVDDEGHLTKVDKARGRKKSLTAMADQYSRTAETPDSGVVFISHADCEDDAKFVADLLKQRHGVEVQVITDVGPVIGAHSGPGTFALFFVAKQR